MTVSEWLALVLTAAQKYFPESSVSTRIVRGTRAKVRIEIGESIFADLFFREETGRIDYTLIVRDERFYGLDNLGGWHEHPLDSPESHVPIEKPTPSGAIQRLRQSADKIVR